ncbi:MAG: hypothetical protein K2X82_32075 [Gemmataceae bacterium]|nr:hypothetical protein [Gemmataceae bacterium]
MPRYDDDDEYDPPRRPRDHRDDDDRPRPRRRPDGDEYDDRPPRRPAGGVPVGLVAGGGVALLAVIGVLCVLLLRKDERDDRPAAGPVAVAQPNPPAPQPIAPVPQPDAPAPKPDAPPAPVVPRNAPAPKPEPADTPVPPGPALPLRGVTADPVELVFGGTAANGAVGVVSYGRSGGATGWRWPGRRPAGRSARWTSRPARSTATP